jgi:hypothetical protein
MFPRAAPSLEEGTSPRRSSLKPPKEEEMLKSGPNFKH